MAFHQVPAFHGLDTIPPLVIAIVYVMLSSLIPEPSRRNFNAIMIAGAGAAYLNGGFGPWEFVFTDFFGRMRAHRRSHTSLVLCKRTFRLRVVQRTQSEIGLRWTPI